MLTNKKKNSADTKLVLGNEFKLEKEKRKIYPF